MDFPRVVQLSDICVCRRLGLEVNGEESEASYLAHIHPIHKYYDLNTC